MHHDLATITSRCKPWLAHLRHLTFLALGFHAARSIYTDGGGDVVQWLTAVAGISCLLWMDVRDERPESTAQERPETPPPLPAKAATATRSAHRNGRKS